MGLHFGWLFSVKPSLCLQHVGLRGLEPTLRAMQSFQPRAETPEEQTPIQNVLENVFWGKCFSLFAPCITFFLKSLLLFFLTLPTLRESRVACQRSLMDLLIVWTTFGVSCTDQINSWGEEPCASSHCGPTGGDLWSAKNTESLIVTR